MNVTVQEPAAGIEIPEKVSAVWPAVKLFVPAPAQVPPAAWFAATAMFTSVSLKLAPVCATLGFVSVRVTVDVPPVTIEDGENAFAMFTRPTPRFAAFEGGPVVLAWVVVTPELVLL